MMKLLLLVIVIGIILFIIKCKTECFTSGTTSQARSTPGKKILILYYTNWCGYCKRFKPEWAKIMEYYKSASDPVECVSIDCEKNDKVCERDGVKGFPTIRLIDGNNGNVINYEGKRSMMDVINFVKSV